MASTASLATAGAVGGAISWGAAASADGADFGTVVLPACFITFGGGPACEPPCLVRRVA